MPPKTTKTAPQTSAPTISGPPRTTSGTESIAELADSIYAESLTAILDEIRGIRNGTVKPEGHDSASRIAWLAQKAAAVAAEERKAAKAANDAIVEITPGVMLTWLRGQTAEVRAKFLRDAGAIDAKQKKSVLAIS